MEKATREQTKDHNSRLVLKVIYDSAQTSRVEIARTTKLTRTTVSSVVDDLIAAGLVREVGHGPSLGGKPPTLLSLASDSRQMIGLDINSHAFNGALVNLRGEIQLQVQRLLTGESGEQALAVVFDLLEHLTAAVQQPLLGIGIGTPGIVDSETGTILRAVNLNWHHLPLRQMLEARFHCPVVVTNNSRAAALGEFTFGVGKHVRDLVVIKAGNGISAGIILDGELLYGNGFGAGEIGHLVVVENGSRCTCGLHGCLETVYSSRAIVEQARQLALAHPAHLLNRLAPRADEINLAVVLQAFEAGDPQVKAIVARAGRYLGLAAAALVSVVNVNQIVIAGHLAQFGPFLAQAVQETLPTRVLDSLAEQTRVEITTLGNDSVVLGGAALLLKESLGVV